MLRGLLFPFRGSAAALSALYVNDRFTRHTDWHYATFHVRNGTVGFGTLMTIEFLTMTMPNSWAETMTSKFMTMTRKLAETMTVPPVQCMP